MKYALAFLTLGATCALYAAKEGPFWQRLVLVCTALAFTGVGLAYGWLGPRVFGKRVTGEFAPVAYAVFWPYLLINGGFLAALRWARDSGFHEIVPGLYLGRKPTAFEPELFGRLRISGVLDLTSEFPAPGTGKRVLHYHCIPLLDTRAPSLEQLIVGVDYMRRRLAEGSVYVHCALGHGRSALFVAAYLVAAGHAATADEAVRRVREKRSGVDLHPCQRQVLEEYVAMLRSALEAEGKTVGGSRLMEGECSPGTTPYPRRTR